MNQIVNIDGIECYEENGIAYLKLETVARGLGFTQEKNGAEYVRWENVDGFLHAFAFSQQDGKRPEYIPENIFYRLAMKARNSTAEAFQAKVADEIIPSIRKNGGYIAGQENESDELLMARALAVSQRILSNREAKIAALAQENEMLRPKGEYFDALVERGTLTNFRETAKEFGIGQKELVGYLIDNGYVYRDKKGHLLPTAEKGDGLFEVKECIAQRSEWSGVQTLITPKGRETFRMLMPLHEEKKAKKSKKHKAK